MLTLLLFLMFQSGPNGMPIGSREVGKFDFMKWETDVVTDKNGKGEINFTKLPDSENLDSAYISCSNPDKMQPGWLIEQTNKHLLFKAEPQKTYHWTCHVRKPKNK